LVAKYNGLVGKCSGIDKDAEGKAIDTVVTWESAAYIETDSDAKLKYQQFTTKDCSFLAAGAESGEIAYTA